MWLYSILISIGSKYMLKFKWLNSKDFDSFQSAQHNLHVKMDTDACHWYSVSLNMCLNWVIWIDYAKEQLPIWWRWTPQVWWRSDWKLPDYKQLEQDISQEPWPLTCSLLNVWGRFCEQFLTCSHVYFSRRERLVCVRYYMLQFLAKYWQSQVDCGSTPFLHKYYKYL